MKGENDFVVKEPMADVVKRSLRSSIPDWKFNLLFVGAQDFLCTKAKMIDLFQKLNVKVDVKDIRAITTLYSGDDRLKILIKFSDIDVKERVWSSRAHFGKEKIFVDVDLPSTLRTVRSSMLKELFQFSRTLRELSDENIRFFKFEWGLLFLGKRYEFDAPSVVNKLRAAIIAHLKLVRDVKGRASADATKDSIAEQEASIAA